MTNGNGGMQQPQQPEEQREITTEEIHRQQRANLALRSLDLEAENVMLQQEVAKLKARIAELEIPPVRRQGHPVPAQSDA
jgi:hypothetical protein